MPGMELCCNLVLLILNTMVLLLFPGILLMMPSLLCPLCFPVTISSPILSVLLCSIALYNLIGHVNTSAWNLKFPNSGPIVGCVMIRVSRSISNVSPGNPTSFMNGTSVPTPIGLRQALDRLCVLLPYSLAILRQSALLLS